MNDIQYITRAARLCLTAHAGQTRKDGITPYAIHPMRVAQAASDLNLWNSTFLVSVAYLHDVLEDTDYTTTDLLKIFPGYVVNSVLELTNPAKPPGLSRAERKEIDRQHLANVSSEAKIIKALDRIDNLTDMSGFDRDFCILYAHESRLLFTAINPGLPEEVSALFARTLLEIGSIWPEEEYHEPTPQI